MMAQKDNKVDMEIQPRSQDPLSSSLENSRKREDPGNEVDGNFVQMYGNFCSGRLEWEKSLKSEVPPKFQTKTLGKMKRAPGSHVRRKLPKLPAQEQNATDVHIIVNKRRWL